MKIPDDAKTGTQFNYGIELHEIIGFYTATEFLHVMYTQLMNETDDLRFVSKWVSDNDAEWTLDFASRFTVLDIVNSFDMRNGF